MAKSFKILNLSFARDRWTGIKVLSAKLSEIITVTQSSDYNEGTSPREVFHLPGSYFVFPIQSSTSAYLMHNPYERKNLEVSELVKSILEIDDEKMEAFFDAELMQRRQMMVEAL